jgi:Tfp pilus assembly protein PilV
VVEVLVALMLLTVGMLGVAGTCARSIRMAGAAARERRAAQRAADRVAVLASSGCGAARSGALVDSAAALTERWVVTLHPSGAALVDADVSWATPRGVRSVLLRSAILC